MVNFVWTPPYSRITITVAMETMHFFILQLSLSLRTKIICISRVPINDLALVKIVLGNAKQVKLATGVLCIVKHFVCRFFRDVAHIVSDMLLVRDILCLNSFYKYNW